MSNLTSVTKYFATANEGFITTTNGSTASGAAIVVLNSVTGLTDGSVFVGIIEPGSASNQQVFTGTVDLANSRITGVQWTRGTNMTHAGGVSVVDYVSGTGFNMLSKGAQVSLNQDGTLKSTAVQTALNTGNLANTGYNTLGYTPNTVVNAGNRSSIWTFTGQDVTGTLSPGMRLRTTRTVSAPTQCASLNGTSHYWSKASPAGMTFTDNWTNYAWVKLNNYPSSDAVILSRFDGTNGFNFQVNTSGQLQIYHASGANTRKVGTYQSLPLNKWVHVAMTVTASTATYNTYIDGVSVPNSVASTGGTPTSITQAGNLSVGAGNSTNFFPGKIAQAAVFSSVLSAATINSYISQGLAGTETSLISAYSFNGVATDLNANANTLTTNGGAGYVADSPWAVGGNGVPTGTNDFGLLQSATFTGGNTVCVVQAAEGCAFPTSGGISSVGYSSQTVPYNFPKQEDKWILQTLLRVDRSQSPVTNTWYNVFGTGLTGLALPGGSWVLTNAPTLLAQAATAVEVNTVCTVSPTDLTETDTELSCIVNLTSGSTTPTIINSVRAQKPVNVSTMTPYYWIYRTIKASNTNNGIFVSNGGVAKLEAKNAYL